MSYLPLRDPDGLASFVDHVSNPADPLYHRFLTPQELSARFGATRESLDALEARAAPGRADRDRPRRPPASAWPAGARPSRPSSARRSTMS
ncbi:MAG: protease pro-enzyme activation domain-containing protein [Aliidongia sp.]